MLTGAIITFFSLICTICVIIRKRIVTTNSNDLHEEDPLYLKAVETIKAQNKVSTPLIQLSLRIGYVRATAIIDRMEKAGLISTPNEEGKREILIKE